MRIFKRTLQSDRRPRRHIFRFVAALVALLLLAAVLPGIVIAVRCKFAGPAETLPAAQIPPAAQKIPTYHRAGSATYLTLPEWFIVYNTEEYASAIAKDPPSHFPYFRTIVDFWTYYGGVCKASCGAYPFDSENHGMIVIIGSSFAIENFLKGIYENTVGRVSELIAGHESDEDTYAAKTAAEYGHFMHTVPWYEFPFAQKLKVLWKETPAWGAHPFRKWERRYALTLEYGVKAVYGSLIRFATKSAYGDQDLRTFVRASHVPALPSTSRVTLVSKLPDGSQILALPRYEDFTPTAVDLSERGIRFIDIAGNQQILITALTPTGFEWTDTRAPLLFARSLSADPSRQRIAINAGVDALADALRSLRQRGATLEHIYDY